MTEIRLSSLGDTYLGEYEKKISKEIIEDCKNSHFFILNLESTLFKTKDFRKAKTSLLYSKKELLSIFSEIQTPIVNLQSSNLQSSFEVTGV